MFIGRTAELKKLNELYNSNSYECVIIYGRRRIGKTTLIKEFINDKKRRHLTISTRFQKTNGTIQTDAVQLF